MGEENVADYLAVREDSELNLSKVELLDRQEDCSEFEDVDMEFGFGGGPETFPG